MLRFSLFLLGLLLLPTQMVAEEGDWGDFSARFVFDGKIPKPKKLVINADKAAFTEPIYDESLVVNKENRGIANIMVWVRTDRRTKIAIHPSYQKTAKAKVTLRYRDGRFDPHVLLLRTAQTMAQENKDRVAYSPNIDCFKNPPSGVLVPSQASLERRFLEEEPLPCSVSCNIHPWMRGYVLIKANPYMAKSDEHGRLQIKNLPAGEHQLQFWHERAGYLKNLPIGNMKTDDRGRLVISITDGSRKDVEMKVPAKTFE